jgi:multidrug efflux system outer membrane protein
MNHKLIPFLGLVLLLTACPKKQTFERPAAPVPAAFPESAAPPAAAAGVAAADLGWREFFADPKLQSVIEQALQNNRDLRAAALNVEKVQALYRIQRSELYPTVSVGAGVEALRTPRTISSSDSASTGGQYTVGVGFASWELDFFGRIRSLKQAALEQYFATEQAQSATQISLVSSVAGIYLTLAADQENLRLAQATLDAQRTSLELIQHSRDFGIASDLDVHEAQAQVDAARVDIARYSGLVALDENALDLVAGSPVPADLKPDGLSGVADFRDIQAGLPSEVLLRRPDILASEYQLKAAYANIGAARAAFFPSITLTAAAGLVSTDLSDLFKPGAATWSFAPQLVLPIFDSGARKANYRVAEVDRDLAVAGYEKAIQTAFREVSDALRLRTTLAQQQDAQQALVQSLAEAFHLAEARYKAGIDGYLNVLVAQRALYAAQEGLVNVRLARRSNLVALYKVLGGGVQAGVPTAPSPPGGSPTPGSTSTESDGH